MVAGINMFEAQLRRILAKAVSKVSSEKGP